MYGGLYGGIGRYVKEIVLYLLKHEDWSFYLLTNNVGYNELENFRSSKIKLIKCTSSIFSIREQFELFRKIPKCDIFWSPYMNVPFLCVRAKKRIVTLHDVFHIANPNYYSVWKFFLIRLYYHYSVKKSDCILTVSQFSKEEICRFLGNHLKEKIRVILNGCDIPYKMVIAKSFAYRYILFVGSVKPHKNVKNALLAFEKLSDKSIKFIIVGKKTGFITGDKMINPIVSRINRYYERVIFTGNIDDNELYSYYKGASLLLMPSFYEGFGLPIIEAMQFGLPIACSNLSVFHEIDDEKLLFFDPCDIDNIRITIENGLLINKPIEYSPWLTWADTAKQISSVFNNLK